MPLRYYDDPVLNAGMNRDEASWQLPAGACYDALNMLFDGPSRQRGGSTALVSGSQTAFATSLGFAYSQDATTIEELYGANGKTGDIVNINKATGAATTVGSPGFTGTFGRPARHFGFLTFPLLAPLRKAITVAGQAVNSNFTNTSAVTLTAGQQQITLTGADTTTNIRVGAIVGCGDGFGIGYYGRVVSVDTSTKFTVWPAPPQTFTSTTGALGLTTSAFTQAVGGACAASFQNRLLLGNTNDLNSTGSTLITDRRVMYSVLPTEKSTNPIGVVYTGATFMAPLTYPALNFFDVPGHDPIVALEPIDSGRLLILSPTDVMILSGNLVTYQGDPLTTSPAIPYDIYPFDVTSGCLSDLSVMRTPAGIMWAGAEGVFAYWPPIRRSLAHTGMRNLMDNKILFYWQGLVSGANFAIHGAAYARNHYVISGSSAGATWSLACNLSNNAWTRLSGAGTDIFNGARRPSIPQQTFALRYWDQTGAAPSMTNGQTVRLDTMFNQYTPGAVKTDADGSAVTLSLTTRTITGDAETQKLFQRATVRSQQSSTAAAVTVTAQSTIDAADADASRTRTLGNLSNTNTLTLSNATNATPIACTTTANHGLQTDDFVDIDGVLGNLNANGRYRIAVTSATAFTIPGVSGSGAYTSGGKVKKLTETDYQISGLNAGQGASFKFDGAPNNWEYHGVRIAVLERAPVMSS